MDRPLTPPEILLGIIPLLLPTLMFLVRVPAKPEYGFTDSGEKYLKNDSPARISIVLTRPFWAFFCVCYGSAAAYALAEAIFSAVQVGLVSLPSVRNHPRPVVPWQAAWAYLLSLLFTLISVTAPWLSFLGNRVKAWLQILGILLGVIGYVLLPLSTLLSSWHGVVIILAGVTGALIPLWWHRRFSKASLPPHNGA